MLRHYQQAASDAVMSDLLAHGKSGLIAHATGTGKSVTMAEICIQYWATFKKPILVIVHRERLVNQLSDTIRKANMSVAIEMAEQKAHNMTASVTVASVPSLARESRRRRYHAERFGLVIVDEAHRAAASGHLSILNHFQSAYKLGMTATPDRQDQKKLPFDKILHEYRLTSAIKEGHLCSIQAELLPIRIDVNKVKVAMGDFKEHDIDEALVPYLHKIADEIASRKEKHLVFLPLIKTSLYMTQLLNARGLKTIHLDGTTPNVDEVIAEYERGIYDCICNAMLLNEGVDIPCVSCITNLRITKSRAAYSQMIGRGTRLYPSKDRLLILDCLFHSKRHTICCPASLVASTESIERQMVAKYRVGHRMNVMKDLEEAEKRVSQANVVQELRQHEHKKRELIDPLTLDQYEIKGYRPTQPWQSLEPTEPQLEWIRKQGIRTDAMTRGMAHYLYEMSKASNFATMAQERLLRSHGQFKTGMTKQQASEAIEKLLGKYKT